MTQQRCGAVKRMLQGCLCWTTLIISVSSGAAGSREQHAAHAEGSLHFAVSCSSQAQAEFNHAVALLHHMTYPQARQAFERVATIDPGCAMAHWGIAMTLFQPLWPTRPQADALQRGWQHVQTARALQPPTQRERMFVAAAEAFFLEPASADYWLRIRRWEQAMAELYAGFPEDSEGAAFYALAHLATAPSDALDQSHSERAAAILLRIYETNPDHPGAMHYLVHASDAPGRERESLDITRRYEALAPRNPHALHMPTHIYTRLGDWDGVIRGNLKAADAALEFPAGDRGQFVWDEFPHAIEYLIYGYLQKGADDAAATQLQRLRATPALEPSFKTAFHLASTQARYVLERRAWNEAIAIAPRQPANLDWDRYAWPEAIACFAHGMAAVRLGKVSDGRAQVTRLHALEQAMRTAGEDLFARNIQALRLELSAWQAHTEGRQESSVALMIEASELEASTPKHAVTPAPTLPADELLGDLLMEQEQPAAALTAYQRSLERYPRRFNSLLGAARAARTIPDETLARTLYQQLLGVADGGMRYPAVLEANSYLRRKR